MFCTFCGHEVEDGSEFCYFCGEELAPVSSSEPVPYAWEQSPREEPTTPQWNPLRVALPKRETPGMKWYWFYTAVRLPLSMLSLLVGLIALLDEYNVYRLALPQLWKWYLVLYAVQFAAFAVLLVNMVRRAPGVVRTFCICSIGVAVVGSLLNAAVVWAMLGFWPLQGRELLEWLISLLIELTTLYYLKKRAGFFAAREEQEEEL
ncbi:zinc ribbon domain-containing protein [Feifania hominis]|uniref:Zinc ribbon domain-containing protein n=1 Tax=Feifania hominis TaxID=2763660 RepID=A0A926HVX1_9FIRM|nr:zinc ribbon domain-containing protein [Feifania hominis]MBC8537081.1 zinc ribbon domain-containing protein [Feifania hominis]